MKGAVTKRKGVSVGLFILSKREKKAKSGKSNKKYAVYLVLKR